MSQFSFTTAQVETFAPTGTKIDQGTVFFYKRDASWLYLVTNWHVVTGRSPFEPKKSRTGAVPVRLHMLLHKNIGPDTFSVSQKFDFSLSINDEEGESPYWIEHPELKYRIDIAVIRLPNDGKLEKQATFRFLAEDKDIETKYTIEPMADAFVIGYPWGFSSGDGVIPLYKRGSVASDPRLNYGGLPRFLIDCRTAAGMSGAPVLASRHGIWVPNGKFDDSTVIGTVTNFAGVYSGRLEAKHADAAANDAISELGIVWKQSALDRIIEAGVPGTKISEL
ncbi:trypsin-like peptidase domain-containing protein [Mesorhizobium sp. KR9-304]|uniref:trypsin-like peptidase domain-containing protein n=1 Tax=Mesorhizobium sp. KR9-304 TaxID=3156614 RepID=UPI0032B37C9A